MPPGRMAPAFAALTCWLILASGVAGQDAASATAADGSELRAALEDPGVVTIELTGDVALTAASGWGAGAPLALDRSVEIEGAGPRGPKVFAQELFMAAGGGGFLRADVPVEINLRNIHIIGVPLEGMAPAGLWNITFRLEDCFLELWSDSTDPNQLGVFVDRQRPGEFPGSDGNQETMPLTALLCRVQFEAFDCPDTLDFMLLVDVAFDWSETGTEVPAGQEDTAPGVFSAVNTPVALFAAEIITVTDTISIVEAFQNPGASRLKVFVITDSLVISEDDIDCSDDIIFPSTDIMFFGAAASVPPVDLLDFNFALSCFVLQAEKIVSLTNLLLNNTIPRDEPRWQPLVPFFTANRDARMELQNVVWNVVSDTEPVLTAEAIVEDIQGRQVPEGESEERVMEVQNEGYCSDELVGASSSCSASALCSELSACPDGAVAVDSVAYRFEGVDYKVVSSVLIARKVSNDSEQVAVPAQSPAAAPAPANETTMIPAAAAPGPTNETAMAPPTTPPANGTSNATEPSANGTAPVNMTEDDADPNATPAPTPANETAATNTTGTADEPAVSPSPAVPSPSANGAAPPNMTVDGADVNAVPTPVPAPANETTPANAAGDAPDPGPASAPTNGTGPTIANGVPANGSAVPTTDNDTTSGGAPGPSDVPSPDEATANGTAPTGAAENAPGANATMPVNGTEPGAMAAAGPDASSSQINGTASPPGSETDAAGPEVGNMTEPVGPQGSNRTVMVDVPVQPSNPEDVVGSNNPDDGSNGSSSAALVGGIGAAMTVLICMMLTLFGWRRYKRRSGRSKALIETQLYEVPSAQHTALTERDTPPQPTFTKVIAVDDDKRKVVLNVGSGEEEFSPDEAMSSSSEEYTEDSMSQREAASRLFENIEMGELLGQGAYGRVYRGTWSGAVVAVKVFTHTVEDERLEASIEREIHFMTELRHPNVVQQYKAGTRYVTPKSPTKQTSSDVDMPTGSSSVHSPTYESAMHEIKHSRKATKETWMVMEYCDLGILSNAIKTGWFYTDDSRTELKMDSVVRTAQDIARGCQYLHENRTVHGDLKPHNILLATSAYDSRRWNAKLADFGVSRRMGAVSHIYTSTVGTMAYLSPEILRDGKLSEGADVYAYGMIMWQLVCGESVFKQKTAADVWRLIAVEKWRPVFPRAINARYQHLAKRCWAEEAHDRPTFQQIQRELGVILQSL